jgi:hypothetical protein
MVGDGSRDFPEGTRLLSRSHHLLEANTMTIKTRKLLHQIQQARQIGQNILHLSRLGGLNLSYVFATDNTLVINCRDYQSAYVLDDAQIPLWQAIHTMGLSIQSIKIEKGGKLFCHF